MSKTKKVSKIALTTILAASVIPAAVVGAETPAVTDVENVVIVKDGENITLTKNAYAIAVARGQIQANDVKYIEVGGKFFTLNQYAIAVATNNNSVAEGIQNLLETKTPTELDTVPGKIVDGELVPVDETSEENLNETFFYNLAA